MFKNIVPITREAHKNKKVAPVKDFNFVSDVHIASVMVHEFSRLSSIYPIVFLENPENGGFKPVVLLGLEQGENLFVEDGKWNASYVPAIIRRYPFVLAKGSEENKYTVCIDEGSNLLNEEEGEALFNEDGEGSEVIERVKQYLGELQQMEMFTEEFAKFMAENNMFTPLNMKVRVENEIKNIAGAYVINEERLNGLSNEKYLELREKQYMPVVYSHLSSLSQIERLLKLKTKESEAVETVESRFE